MRYIVVAIASALLFSVAQTHSAEPIGPLFFTPAQRAQLDTARSQQKRGIVTPEPAQPSPPPEIVTYSGMVRRSDGKSTVWINNHPVQGRDVGGVAIERVRPDGVVTLKVPQTSRDVKLKVGQSLDVVSGTIEEPFDRPVAAPKPGESIKPAGSTDGAAAKTKTISQRAANGPDTANDADNQQPADTTTRGNQPSFTIAYSF